MGDDSRAPLATKSVWDHEISQCTKQEKNNNNNNNDNNNNDNNNLNEHYNTYIVNNGNRTE